MFTNLLLQKRLILKTGRAFGKIIFIYIFLFSHPLKTFAFDTWWHAECTRKAMVANGFSADARLATQVSNYFTDFMAVVNMGNDHFKNIDNTIIGKIRLRSDNSYDFLHFDAIYTTADIEKNWKLILENTKAALNQFATSVAIEPGFRQIVLFNIIGASLHIVQDFYSHSNWVNTFIKNGSSPIPIWYNVPDSMRKQMKLFTGIYAKPFNAHVSHDSLHKDNSARLYSKEAVETAERASIDWIKRLMAEVPELDWAGLKSYNIQNNMVMKNFLVKLDATFLTSSSIVASKLDGENAAKKIFSTDNKKEMAQAVAALDLTLNEYATYMLADKNKFKMPSPYWAGFMGYYITHTLAKGLKLNGEIFSKPK